MSIHHSHIKYDMLAVAEPGDWFPICQTLLTIVPPSLLKLLGCRCRRIRFQNPIIRFVQLCEVKCITGYKLQDGWFKQWPMGINL